VLPPQPDKQEIAQALERLGDHATHDHPMREECFHEKRVQGTPALSRRQRGRSDRHGDRDSLGTPRRGRREEEPLLRAVGKPFVLVKSPDLLCDFNHPSWCAGANLKADPGAEIEIAAAAITLIGAVVTIIKGAIYVWFKWLRRYKGKHEGHLVGTCLTQSGGNVIWGKCGTGTTGAVATSRMWEVVPTLNNAIEYVNYYWQNKGQVLFLTEPQKITANGHLRLHALFPGSGGQQSQEWKLEYK
jgi:hypothetical protein